MAEQLAQPKSPETKGKQEVAEVAGERLKEIENKVEKFDEASQERAVEQARQQVEQEAVFSKEQSGENRNGGEPSSSPAVISKQQKQVEYGETLKEVRSQLSKPSRAFSKVIHTPTIEKASDVAGGTIARPNAILAGSFTAFVVVLGLYVAASYFGFRLSGFELIGAFALGWVVGVGLDVLRVIFKRRRSL